MMKAKPYLLYSAVTLGLLLLLTTWFAPFARAAYHQSQGGRILEIIRSQNPPPLAESIPCSGAIELNDGAQAQLRQAVADLEKARQLRPHASHTHLLLARAYCWLGEAGRAVEFYHSYTQLRPDNPLGYVELGFAQEAVCLQGQEEPPLSTLPACSDPRALQAIQAAWTQGGVQLASFLPDAEWLFGQRRYQEADQLYRYAYRSGAMDLQTTGLPVKLRWAVAAVMSGAPLPAEFDASLSVFSLDDDLQIPVKDMRWLRSIPEAGLEYGDPAGKFSPRDSATGILYWNGQVVALVRANQAGSYRLTVRGQNQPPAPTLVSLEHNLTPLGELSFDREDGSFSEFQFRTSLPAGVHLIGLAYKNNAVVDGLDRDAHLEWIRIERIPES